MSLQKKLLAQIKAAGTGLKSRPPIDVEAVIRDALSKLPMKLVPALPSAAASPGGISPSPVMRAFDGGLPDFVSSLLGGLGLPSPLEEAKTPRDVAQTKADNSVGRDAADTSSAEAGAAQFLAKSFTNHAGTRAYKLYIPSSYHGQAMPLMVMLHGCTQHPDDFAKGTRMNIVAEERQCFVVYPAQSQGANSSKCWNWFNAADQQRDQGEPSIIAGITREVIEAYQLDTSRVYVAGLSAGGAMAVIMGTVYPDLYAAVGVHSGLPYAAANDLSSAFSAMRGSRAAASRQHAGATPFKSIPIIVFHGDRDTTVSALNGDHLIAQHSGHHEANADAASAPLTVIVEDGKVTQGHAYKRISHHRDDGRAMAEHWVIHGAGHAWAGGSTTGSYTDAAGPDATREMMRFFYTQSSTPAL